MFVVRQFAGHSHGLEVQGDPVQVMNDDAVHFDDDDKANFSGLRRENVKAAQRKTRQCTRLSDDERHEVVALDTDHLSHRVALNVSNTCPL